jgi:hypothetical protein
MGHTGLESSLSAWYGNVACAPTQLPCRSGSAILSANGPVLFNLPMSSNGAMPPDPGLPTTGTTCPVTDDFGLPVKPPLKALARLVLTYFIVCDALSAAAFAYGMAHRVPGLVVGITAGFDAIALIGGGVSNHTLKLDQALGATGRRVMDWAFRLTWLGLVLVIQSFDAHANSV